MPYPDNMPSAYKSRREYICKHCEQEPWMVDGKMDFGTFHADEEDESCPTCGKAGE